MMKLPGEYTGSAFITLMLFGAALSLTRIHPQPIRFGSLLRSAGMRNSNWGTVINPNPMIFCPPTWVVPVTVGMFLPIKKLAPF